MNKNNNKNNQTKKAFLAGFLFAVVLFAGKDIFALGMKIQAYFCDDYKIEIDDVEVKLPYGMRILNYVDRTYTPVRLIAEEMGGTVKWDETTKTIKITKPKPKIVEKIIEKKIEVPVDSETKNNYYYQNPPIKSSKKDFTLEITGINIKDNLTYVYIDAENKTGEAVDVLYDQAEIKGSVNVYLPNVMSAKDWGDSMQVSEKRKGKVMYFDKVNDEDKKITLRIPVKSLVGDSFNEIFEYNIIID